jgi:signal peptidase I
MIRGHTVSLVLRDILIGSLLALFLSLGLYITQQQFIIQQISMIPNLYEGQRVFVNKTAYLLHSPERGDIIVFSVSQYPDEITYIKRVIGLPGETIEIKSGAVYVNGSKLQEAYVNDNPQYVLKPLTIPDQHYFVLGDNRNYSHDSHEGWTVPQTYIVGKAWISIWPLEKWGLVPNYAYADK